MKRFLVVIGMLLVLIGSSLGIVNGLVYNGYAEVTRSGDTFTGKVNGATCYTGARLFDAVNACPWRRTRGRCVFCHQRNNLYSIFNSSDFFITLGSRPVNTPLKYRKIKPFDGMAIFNTPLVQKFNIRINQQL